MGKTRRTYRDRLDRFEQEVEPMERALRREFQTAFTDVLEAARVHSMAAGAANTTDPKTTIWLSILVNQQKQITELKDRVAALEDHR